MNSLYKKLTRQQIYSLVDGMALNEDMEKRILSLKDKRKSKRKLLEILDEIQSAPGIHYKNGSIVKNNVLKTLKESNEKAIVPKVEDNSFRGICNKINALENDGSKEYKYIRSMKDQVIHMITNAPKKVSCPERKVYNLRWFDKLEHHWDKYNKKMEKKNDRDNRTSG